MPDADRAGRDAGHHGRVVDAMIPPNRVDDALADAIWWFHGFKAAIGIASVLSPFGETDQTHGLGDKMLAVRERMSRLAEGKARAIGSTEREMSIAITEAEFDRMRDAFQPNATDDDRKGAKEIADTIWRQFEHERASAFNPEAPF